MGTPTFDAKALLSDLTNSSLASRLSQPNDEAYNASIDNYFAQQEQKLHPAGILTPTTTHEVAEAIKIIAKHHAAGGGAACLAVRSGGKSARAGSSNVDGGITIDLSKLDGISIAEDRQTATLGAGLKWGDVYPVLEAEGLCISGGRDASVGVGGLTLAGGLSLFGNKRGFACDDVVNFEVVLGDGKIVEASEGTNVDLYRALKGGSNNFGIVTKFRFRCFPSGEIWGGQNVYPIDTAAHHLDALYDFAEAAGAHATIITSFAIYEGNVIINEGMRYTKPVDDPPEFAKFLAIKPVLYSSNKITSMSAATVEQAGFNQKGRRQALMTTTFANDREMLHFAFETWHDTVPAIKAMADVQWGITLQPLTRSFTQRGQQTGGNVFGLEGAPTLIIAQISISWDRTDDDDTLVSTAMGILESIDEKAKEKGLYHPYLYLGYCWSTQKPIDGYGKANKEFMQQVSRRYDPNGLFQTGLRGGFKLFD